LACSRQLAPGASHGPAIGTGSSGVICVPSASLCLLARGRAADAVGIFRLNVEEYPEQSNPYDSLGEALLALGDTTAAIRNYERSVQLDPGNAGGLAVLRRLRAR
jgi:tetratricopeptide (TPR) repeat protein